MKQQTSCRNLKSSPVIGAEKMEYCDMGNKFHLTRSIILTYRGRINDLHYYLRSAVFTLDGVSLPFTMLTELLAIAFIYHRHILHIKRFYFVGGLMVIGSSSIFEVEMLWAGTPCGQG